LEIFFCINTPCLTWVIICKTVGKVHICHFKIYKLKHNKTDFDGLKQFGPKMYVQANWLAAISELKFILDFVTLTLTLSLCLLCANGSSREVRHIYIKRYLQRNLLFRQTFANIHLYFGNWTVKDTYLYGFFYLK